jgi:hypothetical protein
LALSSLVLAGVTLAGAPLASAVEETTLTPKQVFENMVRLISSAKTFKYHAEILFDQVLENGQTMQLAGARDVRFRRPDGYAVDHRDDVTAKRFWYDGKTATLADLNTGTYVTKPAPATVEELELKLRNDYGVVLPLAGFTHTDPLPDLVARIQEKRYLGVHDVEGIACHHYAFREPSMDWQIWIDAGKQPLPRKIVINRPQEIGSPQQTIVFTDWEIDRSLSANDFKPALDKDWVKVDFLPVTDREEVAQ